MSARHFRAFCGWLNAFCFKLKTLGFKLFEMFIRGTNSCVKSFRMTLFPLARRVTTRRADGGRSDSSLIKITFCQQTFQNHGRRLRGIPFLPCIQWTAPNSYYYCSFSCFFTKIFSMDFKLPHDILCRRAAHDNRRADGGLSDSSLIKITY